MRIKRFYVFALAALGEGISGGDRIFIEISRRIEKKSKVTIFVNEEGEKMCRRQALLPSMNLDYIVWQTGYWRKLGFVGAYFGRVLNSIINSLSLEVENQRSTIIYSASEFWMDSLAAFILKLRYPRVTWVAAWYQTAPNPLHGFSEGKRDERYNFKAFLYWLAQLPIKPIVSVIPDLVLINNEKEKERFPKLRKLNRLFVMLGAIDLKKINAWRKSHKRGEKVFDAVFQGRLHPQKGVVELIAIWKKVVEKKYNARLAIIGDGPLMSNVKLKIMEYKLQKHIKLFGYVFDGDKKYRIFSKSKIVVHPAFYDSGGMASAEAMAFGIPCVGFDLQAYDSYYPKGMLKVETGNLNAFADGVLKLLRDNAARQKYAKDAIKMLQKNWSWDYRTEELIKKIEAK